MMQTDIIVFIAKLVAGGIIAFLAIMLWSKTRNASWMCLVTGAVFSYSATVFDLLVALGVATSDNVDFFGFGVRGVQLCLTLLTSIFIILAFVMMFIAACGEKDV